MYKPPAELQSTIQPHYDNVARDATNFATQLVRILLALSSSELTEAQLKALKDLRAKIYILLLEVKGIEELTRDAVLRPGVVPNLISESLAQSYLFQILLHYGFIFQANNCFIHLLADGTIEECWPDVNKLLRDSYHQLYPLIHENIKSERYIGTLIVTILKEILSLKLFINGRDELASLTLSYLFFRDFISRMKCIPLKLQCEIYMFMVEYQENVYDKFAAFQLEARPKDQHEKIILNLLAEFQIATMDDEWYRYFAYATKLFRYVKSLGAKITCFQEKPSEASKVNCVLDVKNYSAVYNEVLRLFNSFNWLEFFEKLEKALKSFNTLRFDFSKILQTKYLLENLLDVLARSLTLSVNIIDFTLKNTKERNWQLYYNLLQLKKTVLDNQLKLIELHQTIEGTPKTIDETILNTINGIVCALRAMDFEAARIDEKFNVIKATKKQKRIARNRRNHNEGGDHSDTQSNSDSPSENEISSDEESTPKECAGSATKPEPSIISMDIPLPEFVHHITRLFSQENIGLQVVGGYVRDALQEKKAKDIDAIIYDRTLKLTDNGLLYKILDRIKSHYPNAEIRGQRHPVLYIEHQKMILEISCLKVSRTPSNEIYAKEDNSKLFHEDAFKRDTTDCALYYDPEKKTVIDFFNGVSDIQNHRLVTISPPNITFSKEPVLIFRVLRSIIKRSVNHPDLIYSQDIIGAMRQHIERLSTVNRDRCFREICNLFFNGFGCATWQFLSRYELAKYFLNLPEGEDLNFKHSAMVQRALSSLDSRVRHGKSFHHSFTFAVLLWGTFCEHLQPQLTEGNVLQAAENVCNDNRLIFRLPKKLVEEIKTIWFTYLHYTKKLIFNKPNFKNSHYVLAKLLANFIKRAMHIHHKSIAELRNGFFHRSRLECIIKDIISSYKIVYSYSNKITTLSLEKTKTLDADPISILKKLKHFLINMLGDEYVEIEVDYDQNVLYLSTDYFDKKTAIERLMDFAFAQGNEEVIESRLLLIQN